MNKKKPRLIVVSQFDVAISNGYSTRIEACSSIIPTDVIKTLVVRTNIWQCINLWHRKTIKNIDVFSNRYNHIYFVPVLLWPFGSLLIKLFLNFHLKIKSDDIVVAESNAAAISLTGRFLSIEYILDLHGLTGPEVRNRSRHFNRSAISSSCRSLLADWIDKKCILGSKKVIVVSNTMKNYINEHYDYDLNRIFVLPCVLFKTEKLTELEIKEKKNSIRLKYNIPRDYPVVGYVGGIGAYQCFPEMLDFLVMLQKHIKNLTVVLVISGNPETYRNALSKIKNKIIFNNVQHAHAVDLTYALDFGILFRSPDLLNKVASPTKFGEYLCAGAHVLITPGVGDCTDELARYNLGYIVNNPNDFKTVKYISNQIKHRKLKFIDSVKWVHKNYYIDKFAAKYLEFIGLS